MIKKKKENRQETRVAPGPVPEFNLHLKTNRLQFPSLRRSPNYVAVISASNLRGIIAVKLPRGGRARRTDGFSLPRDVTLHARRIARLSAKYNADAVSRNCQAHRARNAGTPGVVIRRKRDVQYRAVTRGNVNPPRLPLLPRRMRNEHAWTRETHESIMPITPRYASLSPRRVTNSKFHNPLRWGPVARGIRSCYSATSAKCRRRISAGNQLQPRGVGGGGGGGRGASAPNGNFGRFREEFRRNDPGSPGVFPIPREGRPAPRARNEGRSWLFKTLSSRFRLPGAFFSPPPRELIRGCIEIARDFPRNESLVFFISEPPIFFLKHVDNARRGLIARAVAKIIRACARYASWISHVATAASLPRIHILWILMARFVFTTRGWIFHRCERRKGVFALAVPVGRRHSKMTNGDVTGIVLLGMHIGPGMLWVFNGKTTPKGRPTVWLHESGDSGV